MIRLLVAVIIGFGVVGGQLCLAAFARGFTPTSSVIEAVLQALRSLPLYGAGVFYLVAIGLYLGLLRTGAVSATNLPIMAVVVILNIALSFTPGEAMSHLQIAGAVCVGVGLILMQSA